MDSDTLLLRHVHPSWMVGDIISQQTFSSQVFKPTPKDDGLLSVYNGNSYQPCDSYEHYTQTLCLQSAGVVAVTHEECCQVNLPVIEDNHPFEGHCSIDYRELNGSAIKKASAKLKKYAQDRSWLYIKD
jgi:hypothetical protein